MTISPFKIKVMLAYYYASPAAVFTEFRNTSVDSPAMIEAHKWAVDNGLLTIDVTGKGTEFRNVWYSPTDILLAYVEHLKEQPLPVVKSTIIVTGVSTMVEL